MFKFLYKDKESGFTFVEIMIVITIIGILTLIVLGAFTAAKVRGRDGQRKSSLSIVQAALEQYKADYDHYPCFGAVAGERNDCNGNPGWGDLRTLTNDPNGFYPKYLHAIPSDPLYQGSCGGANPVFMYWHGPKQLQYALFTYIESSNDTSAIALKPVPPNSSSMGACGTTCATFNVTSGACSGAKYNYWVQNP